MKSPFVLIGVLVCSPLYAQEPLGLKLPTTAFLVAASADWATTYAAVKHYELRETNIMLRGLNKKPARMILLGGAVDVGSVLLWNRLIGRTHPKIAAVGLWTMTAFRVYLVTRNTRNMQHAQKR